MEKKLKLPFTLSVLGKAFPDYGAAMLSIFIFA
jgi:hypothetical protein